MPVLFVFLLKVNIALLLFCAGYYLVLRHLTFYTLNRIYLVAAILFATIYPQINLSGFLQQHQQIAKPVEAVAINWQGPATLLIKPLATPVYWNWIELAFWAGVVLLALRLAMQLYSLSKLYRSSSAAQIHNHDVRLINTDSGPFSFWKSIYVNPANIKPADLKSILMHEQVHVNEWHTLDILIAELSTIFYWFNPGVWLMKKAVRENIEFITDRKILKNGADTKQYQYSLVSVSFAASPNTIFNHFNISAIKKRIIMMNAERSSKFKLSRYAFLIPAVVGMLLIFSISKAAFIKKIAPVKHRIAVAKPIPVPTIEKQVKKSPVVIDSIQKRKTIMAVIHATADTQATPNPTVSNLGSKTANENIKKSISIDNLGAVKISQNGEPIKPLLYIVDGRISKDYDEAAVDPNNIKRIDVGETADKKSIVYITTKNGFAAPAITTIRINGEPARHLQGLVINGKLAVVDTVKVFRRMDTSYLLKAKPPTFKVMTGMAKFSTPLTITNLHLQTKPVLRFHAKDSVITKPAGIVCLYGKAEVNYGTSNLKADYIEYDKRSNTIKAKGSVVFTKKQNNETLTSTASDFLWELKK